MTQVHNQMAKKNPKKSYQWTKEGLNRLIKLWKSHTLDEIVEAMDMPKHAIQYMAGEIRKERPELMPKKHQVGKTRKLLKEVLSGI